MNSTPALTVEARGEREIVMTRAFDAPRPLVFEALTRPELLERWLGVFAGWPLAVCELDLRVGGAYRYVWHGPDGQQMGMHGVYREVAPPERLVNTETFDDPWYSGEALVTTEPVERDGRTTSCRRRPPPSRRLPAAFRAAGADVEALLADPALAARECDTPGGRLTVEQHVDRVPSDDLVLHGWDLARATGQDDALDPRDVERMWSGLAAIPPDVIQMLRTPGAFGPGVEVFGPEIAVPADAPLQDRLLGFIGRDPRWAAPPARQA